MPPNGHVAEHARLYPQAAITLEAGALSEVPGASPGAGQLTIRKQMAPALQNYCLRVGPLPGRSLPYGGAAILTGWPTNMYRAALNRCLLCNAMLLQCDVLPPLTVKCIGVLNRGAPGPSKMTCIMSLPHFWSHSYAPACYVLACIGWISPLSKCEDFEICTDVIFMVLFYGELVVFIGLSNYQSSTDSQWLS